MATLKGAKRVVVKIGSALLVSAEDGRLRKDWLSTLAEDVAALKSAGTDVLIVSSGSIALGRRVLNLGYGPLALEQSQAAASVGQIRLARAYEEVLAPHGITTGQILVTLEDSSNRRRYLNSRATMETLLSLGVVPIVNENDTVATDEIRFGDNDRLAAQVAVTVGADTLVLLSDVDGFYTANPQMDKTAERLDFIQDITPEIEQMAGDAGTGMAKGGMKTKVMAAKTATTSGCAMVISKGSVMHPLAVIDAGAPVTWFAPQLDPQTARKRWIASIKPMGEIWVDVGAVTALQKGKSLLPAGVVKIKGQFLRGDAVVIRAPDDREIGRGLSGYSASEAKAIKGLKSGEVESVLGYTGRAALIHRNDMAD
jgi:glutamate 5-kinase